MIGERYRLVEPLARGGFGAVYVAEQLATERRVALKILVRYAEDVSVEVLLAEARVTSRIVSDHIVQVIDAGVDGPDGDVFVVMELLRGCTLDDRVLDHGPIPAPDVAELLRQVAIGLDKAHGHVDRAGGPAPIIHRDLKPSNLFITERDDGRPLVKILDFGAAKVLSQTTKASGMIRGTPQFMACEQALGEPSSVETDVWALGLIAFYLLTGRSYWLTVEFGGTQAQIFAEILNLPLPPASARAQKLGVTVALSPAFDAWFARCVNRERSQRFGSAGLAAAELMRALGVPLPSHRVTTPPPAAVVRSLPSSAPARLLETQDLAALSSSRALKRASRTRVGLAVLGVGLAGAAGAAVVVSSKAATPQDAAPTHVSASPTVSALPVTPSAPAAPRPSPSEVTSPAPSRRPVRTKPPARKSEAPTPTPAPPRDPYEQR